MQIIRSEGYTATSIHGDKSQAERDSVLKDFRNGKSNILIATDVASRGLDVEDLQYVINYDYPNSSENYVHRIGRTGRCQQLGTAYTFFTPDNAKQARELISVLEEAGQQPSQPLLDMARSMGGGGGNRNNNNKRWQTPNTGGQQQQQRSNPLNYQANSGGQGGYTPKPQYQQYNSNSAAGGGGYQQQQNGGGAKPGGMGNWNNRSNNGGQFNNAGQEGGRPYRPRAPFNAAGNGGPRPMMGGYVPHPHMPPHMQQQAGGYMAPQQYRPRGQYMQPNGGNNPRFQQYQKRDYQQQQNGQNAGQYQKQQLDQNSQQDAAAVAAQQQQMNVAANIAAAVAAAGGQVGGPAEYPNVSTPPAGALYAAPAQSPPASGQATYMYDASGMLAAAAAAAGNPYATGQYGPPPTAYYAHPHQFAAAPNGVATNANAASQGAELMAQQQQQQQQQ